MPRSPRRSFNTRNRTSTKGFRTSDKCSRCPSLPHHETEADVCSYPGLPPVPRRTVHPPHGLQHRPGCHWRCPLPRAKRTRMSYRLWGSTTPPTGKKLHLYKKKTSSGDLFLTVLQILPFFTGRSFCVLITGHSPGSDHWSLQPG